MDQKITRSPLRRRRGARRRAQWGLDAVIPSLAINVAKQTTVPDPESSGGCVGKFPRDIPEAVSNSDASQCGPLEEIIRVDDLDSDLNSDLTNDHTGEFLAAMDEAGSQTGNVGGGESDAAQPDSSLAYSIDVDAGDVDAADGFKAAGGKNRSVPVLPKQIGDYEIGELLGSGGMGHVYVARHVRMQRKVALKVLPAELMADEASIEHFYEEVRAAGRLMHPNIVTALDAGEQDGIHYLVMEFVDGVTLSTLVAAGGPQSVGAASGIIRQAAMGLLHAHRAGIIHRDVKPGNMMRSSDGTIKLLDMGLAHVHRPGLFSPELASKIPTVRQPATSKPSVDPSKSTTKKKRPVAGDDDEDTAAAGVKRMLVGTLPYMAPEQLEEASQADYRADIYSLGATLHFLLTGRTPFSGPYIDQVYGHRHGPIPDLMTLRDDVDMNFAHILERMMAKQPGQRYQSLDEVVESLAPYATQSTVPDWLAEFTRTVPQSEFSHYSGGTAHSYGGSSRTSGVARSGAASSTDEAWVDDGAQRLSDDVLGIDFEMFNAAAASCSSNAKMRPLAIESSSPKDSRISMVASVAKLFRCMIASDAQGVYVGTEALSRRVTAPQSVVHCLPLYIGMETVPRSVAGRRCPPEALMGLLLRQIAIRSMDNVRPVATAVTVLGAYDQLHRRSILQSAIIANLPSIRLIDRSLACVASVVHPTADAANGFLSVSSANNYDEDFELIATPITASGFSRESEPLNLSASSTEMLQNVVRRKYILYVGLSGQGAEAAVLRIKEKSLKQLAAAGHWSTGSLVWLQRLVDMAAQRFRQEHDIEIKKALGTAAKLQMACEQAMLSMSILPSVTITVNNQRITVDRDDWLTACSDLIGHLRSAVRDVLKISGRHADDLELCVAYGPLLRIQSLRRSILSDVPAAIQVIQVDFEDAARGAALCVSSQLPGRTGHPVPPRSVASQSLGLVIEDAKERRRILPIVTRGSMLPARSSRRITVSKSRKSMIITVAETSGVNSRSWQTLGKHEVEIETDTEGSISRTLSFEVDINGILSIRVQGIGGSSSTRMEDLPRTKLSDNDLMTWRRWVAAQ